MSKGRLDGSWSWLQPISLGTWLHFLEVFVVASQIQRGISGRAGKDFTKKSWFLRSRASSLIPEAGRWEGGVHWRGGSSRIIIPASGLGLRSSRSCWSVHTVSGQTEGMGSRLGLSQSVCLLTVPTQGTLGCWIPDSFLLSFSVVCPHLGTAAVSPQGVSWLGNRWENWNPEIGSACGEDVPGLPSAG